MEDDKPTSLPPQHQDTQPGYEEPMTPAPQFEGNESGELKGKLQGKVVLITGGDSGIGRAIAVAFAKEGAKLVINYLNEDNDANITSRLVEEAGSECTLVAGDIGDENFCNELVTRTVEAYGGLDILINNAAEQHAQTSIQDISKEQLEKTFQTNIFSQFYLSKAALRHMKEGSAIVNNASVTAYIGNPRLVDYSSTKGAIISFTRSLALQLAKQGIRVNAVAPGPIWTPLIPASFPPEDVATFGQDTPLQRPGQPEEVAPAFLYLASDDSSYVTGQTIHVNGGTIVNG